MARIKPQATINSTGQADEALRRLAELDRAQRTINDDLNANTDMLKAKAMTKLEPLAKERAQIESDLAVFATTKKDELFGETKGRSIELAFGIIGFRKTPAALRLLSKWTMAKAIEQLKRMGFNDCIRIKAEVDKTAMAEWHDEQLAAVGFQRVSKDEFFIDLKQEELPGQA